MNRAIFCVMVFLFCSCENQPQFVKQVPHLVLISKSYTVQEFVRNQAEILWVIDNSGSMAEEQEALMENMGIFINAFTNTAQGLDAHWRMALLSTDRNEQPYVGLEPWDYLDHNHPDPVGRFNKAISKLGVYGSSLDEQAFVPIRLSLSIYRDFVRENSKLFIIIVSDEDEQSGAMPVDDFISFLHTLKDPDSISTYGVFPMEDENCGLQIHYPTSRYGEFIAKTNGLVFPLCSGDYGKGLALFGSDIAKKTSVSKIQLDEAPVVETINVHYRGKSLPEGRTQDGGFWSYNSVDNAIHFHNLDFLAGFDLEKVRVDYQKARLLEN